jgi:glycosyltransferase involved in cell wall biosynthesis
MADRYRELFNNSMRNIERVPLKRNKKILWIVDRKGWAYEQRAELLSRKLDRYDHELAYMHERMDVNNADIVICPYPSFLKSFERRQGVIQYLGGYRVFSEVGIEKVLSEVSAIIAVNNDLTDRAEALNKNTYFIPSGIDLDLFKPKKDNHRKFKAGFVGNIDSQHRKEYKGYDIITEACRLCNIELITLSCDKQKIPHKEMPGFYNSIDVLISASEKEGCSNTIAEALACGVPVILSKTGYHGEKLTSFINCIFIERDINSLRMALMYLYTNKDLLNQIGTAGRQFAEAHHNVDNQLQTYYEILEKCENRKS